MGQHRAVKRGLCTSINPVTRDVMCELRPNHKGLHRAEGSDVDGGTWVMEWADRSRIQALLHGRVTKAQGEAYIDKRKGEIE